MASVTTYQRQGVVASAAIKVPCKAATTANITLSGEQTIDGVAIVTNDRVLVKNQTTASENGIYIANTSTWSRAPDWDGSYDVKTGTITYVTNGSTNIGWWKVTTTGTITVGTTSVTIAASGLGDAADTTYNQGGTGAVDRTQESKNQEFVSVKDFGAAGDGVTDDTAAIQASGAASKHVYVPSGTYIVSNIAWTTDVQLVLAADAVIKHKASSSDHMIESTAELRISGGTLDGNKASNTNRDMNVVYCTGDKFIAENVIFQNSIASAIECDGVGEQIRIHNCYFTGMEEHNGTLNDTTKSIYIENACDRVDISHNWFIGGTPTNQQVAPSGIHISGTSISVRVIGNYFEKIGQNETNVANFLGCIDLYTDADDTVVANNVFVDSYYTPLKLQNCKNLVCANNVISGYLGLTTAMLGWQMTRDFGESLVNASITGNIIDITGNTTSVGLSITHQDSGSYQASKVVASNNVVTGGLDGVNLRNIHDLTLTNNVISDCNTNGIELVEQQDAKAIINIDGNMFDNIGTTYLQFNSASNTNNLNLRVTNNTFDAGAASPSRFMLIRGEAAAELEKVVIANNMTIGTASAHDISVRYADEVIIANNLAEAAVTALDNSNNTTEIIQGNSWQTPQTYTPTNVVTDRAYDANATTTAELADVLGTLIADLQTAGILK